MRQIINFNLIYNYIKTHKLTVKSFCKLSRISTKSFYKIQRTNDFSMIILLKIAKSLDVELKDLFIN